MAVYTEVTDEDLEALLKGFTIGTLHSFKGIAEGVENTNFVLRTSQDEYILTLYEKRVDPNDLPFFIGLMEHLAAKGIPCPTPIQDANGTVLHELCERPAALFSFLQGMWPRRIHVDHCAHLGQALAQFHLAAADYTGQRPNALSVDAWRPLFDAAGGRDAAESVAAGLGDVLEKELAVLESSWPEDLPCGIIHADLFPDNVFFLNGTVSGLIDFYFACSDVLVYDLAICLNAWCFENDGQFNVTKARNLLRGYSKVRPISAAEIEALPVLCRGAAVRFLLTRLYDWLNTPPEAFVKPKDPLEYWQKLTFHQGIASAGAYGLDVE